MKIYFKNFSKPLDTLQLEREEDQLNIMNSATEVHHHKDYIKLYNLGGGAAKKIAIEVLLGNDKVIQKKYVNILPSKEGYMLPINKNVYEELERTIENNGYEADLNVRMTYYHNVSRKQQEVILKGQIDRFNTYNNKEIYDLQFI